MSEHLGLCALDNDHTRTSHANNLQQISQEKISCLILLLDEAYTASVKFLLITTWPYHHVTAHDKRYLSPYIRCRRYRRLGNNFNTILRQLSKAEDIVKNVANNNKSSRKVLVLLYIDVVCLCKSLEYLDSLDVTPIWLGAHSKRWSLLRPFRTCWNSSASRVVSQLSLVNLLVARK